MKRSMVTTLLFLISFPAFLKGQPKKSIEHVKNPHHVIIYHEQGHFAGWPANNGAYLLKDNHIVVGFTEGPYKLTDGHNISLPFTSQLARSSDGGETWKVFDPDNFVGDFDDQPRLKSLQKPINFQRPGFLMRIVGTGYHGARDGRAHFFYSYDTGKTWRGPYGFGDLLNNSEIQKSGLDELTPRTDYVISGKKECLLFFSIRKKNVFASDKLFCIKTVDGGKTFSFQGWVVKPQSLKAPKDDFKVNLYPNEENNPYASECRAVMSQTLRLDNGTLISAMRRKYIWHGGPDKDWIDVYSSTDDGKNWEFLAKVAENGPANGNPPAMAETKDGRLIVIYGDRSNGTIMATHSSDKGKTWGEKKMLMDDFWSEDMELNDLGYPRLVCREDGKLVAIYYYSTKEHLHHLRATIWEP